ncbi:MAG: alpha-amylase family glycosyl hydrolase [Pseudomonadota bacterium]
MSKESADASMPPLSQDATSAVHEGRGAPEIPRLDAPEAVGLTREDSTAPDDVHEYRLREALGLLYGSGAATGIAKRLLQAARTTRSRLEDTGDPRLAGGPRALEARDQLLITYGDSLVGSGELPLDSLKAFADAELKDCISAIHVLPFFPFSSDDGFAVIDYRAVRNDLGDWSEVRALGEHFDLMFDLVINHCSREHLWFADFVGDRAPGNDFFIEADPRTDHSAVTRPRNSPLLTRVHTYRGVRHVWTTFSEDQVDLNFGNPNVFVAFAEILLFYLEQRARFIRLDAVAFLWKRLGTNCMSLPETHAAVRALRSLLEAADLPTQLLTETNVPHAENVSYFGDRDEAHLVYQFSLAPLLLYSYLFEDPTYLRRWAETLDPAPEGCAYLNFIASHDGIGLRPLEGLVPKDAVQALLDLGHERGGYITLRTLADGTESAYELNIALFSAFGGTPADIPRYLAAHHLLLAFQGVPALYVHSLFGTLNDHDGVERTGRTRSINRAQLDADTLAAALADSSSPTAEIFRSLRRALELRREQPAFAPAASQRVVPTQDSRIFVLERRADTQTLLVVASFASESVQVDESALTARGGVDLLTGRSLAAGEAMVLEPFQVLWIHQT